MTTTNTPAVDLAQLSKEVTSVVYLTFLGKGNSVSDQAIDHMTAMVETTKPFYNVDALDVGYVNQFIDEVIQSPETLMAGSVVRDGVLYPSATAEEQKGTIAYMSELDKHEGDRGAASFAFIMQGVLHAMTELNK